MADDDMDAMEAELSALAQRNRQSPYRNPWPVKDWAKANGFELLEYISVIQAAASGEGILKTPDDQGSYLRSNADEPSVAQAVVKMVMQVADEDDETLSEKLRQYPPGLPEKILGLFVEVQGRLHIAEQTMRMSAAQIALMLDEMDKSGERPGSDLLPCVRELLEQVDDNRIFGDSQLP